MNCTTIHCSINGGRYEGGYGFDVGVQPVITLLIHVFSFFNAKLKLWPDIFTISMVLFNPVVSPLLRHWRYCSLALSRWCNVWWLYQWCLIHEAETAQWLLALTAASGECTNTNTRRNYDRALLRLHRNETTHKNKESMHRLTLMPTWISNQIHYKM